MNCYGSDCFSKEGFGLELLAGITRGTPQGSIMPNRRQAEFRVVAQANALRIVCDGKAIVKCRVCTVFGDVLIREGGGGC